ncbi:aminoacyl-tRNA hydrolase [Caldisericum exile]|uniref:Peptidyl-tRNA hydrolase n=1 Tax=Caldisericum exile (strain DSM 21853 / NBRC 104410 / AZM16c01) TaxID=511051 RepID=A0A7U6GFH6_CALEA|nr:aminoacyl-tRNA hydrolase [Caldisericum exile]BAL81445.1 peptidyl-tRNA hydrolase [Caldisericum exile AZM16c01]
MHLIIGLGNIGKEYENTRHNVGFMVIDELSKAWKIKVNFAKFNALYGKGTVNISGNEYNIILAKPLTYMNLSGRAVKQLMDGFLVPSTHIIVIHDDLDLPLGTLRIKVGGSDAGHKGVRSIKELVEDPIIRVRIGIGRPINKEEVVNYVLEEFGKDEKFAILDVIKRSVKAIETIISKGVEVAQREFNQ